jgi:predicted DNA-binding protein
MTSLRLPAELEQKVFSFARTRNQTKSAVILAALKQFFEHEEEEVDSFRIGKDYFGRFGSGTVEPVARKEGRLSVDYKKLVKGKIRAK